MVVYVIIRRIPKEAMYIVISQNALESCTVLSQRKHIGPILKIMLSRAVENEVKVQ